VEHHQPTRRSEKTMKEYYQCSSCHKLIQIEDANLVTSGFIKVETTHDFSAGSGTTDLNVTYYFCSEECMNEKLEIRKK